MPNDRAGKLGDIVFAIAAFGLGAYLIFKGADSTAPELKLIVPGVFLALLAIVLGPEGGFSALQKVKDILPSILRTIGFHNTDSPASSPTKVGATEDSLDDGDSIGPDTVAPEEIDDTCRLTIHQKKFLGFSKAPPSLAKADTELIREVLFETNVPTYILNQDFHILDWNPAFEVAFDVHCQKVRRQHHVSQLIHYLDNSADIMQHGADIFGGPVEPLVDFERLGYDSPTYGRMEFGKITSRATHPGTGATIGWNVVLNVHHVEKQDEYEAALKIRLAEQVNWRVYATSYDRVLMRFSEYKQLLRRHVDAVAARKTVIDLGAGTGNITLELLEAGKEVAAVDYNEAMLSRLRDKCSDFHSSGRLQIIKQNLDYMRIPKSDRGRFDGAIMQNVLYALKDPMRCLKMVREALKPKGILVISGPKQGTSLDALFTSIRNELKDEPDWDESLSHDFENVLERNKEFEDRGVLEQWTVAQVHELLESAGFRVMQEDNDIYAGQAMILIAQRK